MIVISEADDPAFFRFVTDGNLVRQYDFLRYAVEIALRNPTRPISHEIVQQINNHAVVFLSERPGKYRKEPVIITNCPHKPPDHNDVDGLMDECLLYLGNNWNSKSISHLAAYVLWRLNWIHPFVEGNGRTARATWSGESQTGQKSSRRWIAISYRMKPSAGSQFLLRAVKKL